MANNDHDLQWGSETDTIGVFYIEDDAEAEKVSFVWYIKEDGAIEEIWQDKRKLAERDASGSPPARTISETQIGQTQPKSLQSNPITNT